jgi:hypothetical protein
MNRKTTMKPPRLLTLAAALAAFPFPAAAGDFTLHEWGTFTAVIGSDGTHLNGVEREDAPLPGFVYHLDTPRPEERRMTKGLSFDRSFAGVNVRLETPVLYFYTDEAFDARVDVGFKNGTIGQWFPDRSGGEARDPEVLLDFSRPRTGSIQWNVRVEPPGEDVDARVFQGGELPCWLYPRLPDSALVTNAKNETEKYLFYRGLGNMQLPLVFKTTDQELQAVNAGQDAVRQWLVYDYDPAQGARWWTPAALAPGEASNIVEFSSKEYRPDWKKALYADGLKMLTSAGLFRKEADAMLQTWWPGYFDTQGLRVFWIVPRPLVDDVLPLTVDPVPANIERVIVGRSEILRPSFENRLVADFAAAEKDGANRWESDRFFPAYASRVRQLKEATPLAAVLPVGKWEVTFVNGVVETCDIREDGSVHVSQTARTSPGEAEVKDGFVEIRYDDDRAERWSLDGDTMNVQHWHPSASMPVGNPVSGTAVRVGEPSTQAALRVHEWGTFTVLEGSDGNIIDWYQSPARLIDLPAFVHRSYNIAGKSGTAQLFATTGPRGLDSIRMETPVLYFYPEAAMEVTVRAHFPQGRITEVFPPASDLAVDGTFWQGRLLPPDSPERAKVPAADGPRGRHYAAAREVPEAWLFRGLKTNDKSESGAVRQGMREVVMASANGKKEEAAEPIDHFIFYRGAGNRGAFEIRAVQDPRSDGTYTVMNNGGDTIPKLIALRVREGQTSWLTLENLQTYQYTDRQWINQQNFTFSAPAGPAEEVATELRSVMIETLASEGLTPDEANAMVATWDDLWFTEPGTRILAVLPQTFADAMVPLEITPAPTNLDRVFVARVELITREQEQSLTKLLNVPAGTEASDATRAELQSLDLGRFAEGALIRAATLVSQEMHNQFLRLTAKVK